MGLFDNYLLDDEPPARTTSTYDDDEEYFTLQDQETKEKIRKLQISNEKELRNLVEKRLVIAVIGEIGQSIQSNFIDVPKRQSNLLANKLGIPAKEKDIELLLAEIIESGVKGVVSDIERLASDGVWDL